MKRKMTIFLAACLIVSGLFSAVPNDLRAEEVFISIGGGDVSGVYFPTGLAIAKMINSRRPEYHIRARYRQAGGRQSLLHQDCD